MICTIIFINGIYDILCSIGILFLYKTPIFSELSKIHPKIFTKKEVQEHPIIKRIIAYWLITYGSIRIAIISNNNIIRYLVAISYFIEAFAFTFENMYYNTTYSIKVLWIFCSSIYLGIYIIFI